MKDYREQACRIIGRERLNELEGKNIEIIIGIPSYNSSHSIAFVAEQASRGLKKYFPNASSIIINTDGNSSDGTKTAFLGAETEVEKLFSAHKGPRGKGAQLKDVLTIAAAINAKACLFIDSDLQSINEEWVYAMLSPIYEGFDMVTPHYSRYKYDGTITNNICFPVVYGLFCRNLRQPIGGDFAFSRRLLLYWLKDPMWDSDISRYGIDIYMSTLALLGGFKVTQTYLGAKIHDAKDPSGLKPMFKQVVGTLFKVLYAYKKKWMNRKFPYDVKITGVGYFAEPMKFDVNIRKMKTTFMRGFAANKKHLQRIISRKNFDKLEFMAKEKNVFIDNRMWAEIVYDCVLAFPKEGKNRITDVLFPLYQGRNYTFALETVGYEDKHAEERIMLQAKAFHLKRKYLINAVNSVNI